MTSRQLPIGPRALALLVLLLAAPLAGCASSDDGGGDTLYPSYEAAKRAPGSIHEPREHRGGTDLHLKLLEPKDAQNAPQGEAPLFILLFDATSDTPVEDATVTLASQMPAMGHGTSGERAPVHDGHGVYVGQMNLVMPGNWVIELTVTLPNGESFDYAIEARATG